MFNDSELLAQFLPVSLVCKEKEKEGRREALESEEKVSIDEKQCRTVGGAADGNFVSPRGCPSPAR